MAKLNQVELDAALAAQPEWKLIEGSLVREWKFKNFVEAIAFVNRVASMAEEAGHHPDIDIRYNKVRLSLVTHDAGGITESDASLAARLSHESSLDNLP